MSEIGVPDVRDMYAVHEAFRRGLSEVRGQTVAAGGDHDRARRLSDYLADLLWLLHAHHEGEDVLLYPLLVERAPEHKELLATMDAQHGAVEGDLHHCEAANRVFAESATKSDGETLADACEALAAILSPHLDQEEVAILPLVAQHLSVEEWGALPGHALGSYQGKRIWMPFGLAIEAMPEDLLTGMQEHLPPPMKEMWFGGGRDVFVAEMAAIRGA